MPTLPATEDMLTIRPLRCLRMAGSTACVTASMPKKLTSNWARHSSSRTSSTDPYCP